MAKTTTVKAARKAQPNCMSPDCRQESREINVGDSYRWFSIRSYGGGRGTRKVYHVGCHIPESHRTTSAQLGTIYDAQEAAESAMSALDRESDADALLDDLRSIASEAAESIREAAAMYGESADNIEEGFGHSTSTSDELREKSDNVESWATDIESVDLDEYEGEDDDAEFDEDEVRREVEIEVATEMGVEDAASLEAGDLFDALMNIDSDQAAWEDKVNEIVEQKEREHGEQHAAAVEENDDKKGEWLDEQIQKVQDALNESPL